MLLNPDVWDFTIDSQLSWHSRVESICKSFGKKVDLLKRLKYLPKDILQTIYFKNIVPTVRYCSLVWGTCSPTLVNEIDHIHVRAI